MESHGVGSNLHTKKPPGLSLHLPPHTEDLPAVLQWGIPTYGAASGSPSWSMKHFQSIFELPSHPLPTQESFCQRISRQFSEWFAVGKAGKEARQKWQRRALRHCHQRLGSLRRQDRKELELQNHDSVSLASAETPPPFFVGMQKVYDPLARGRAFRNADEFDSVSNPPTPHSPGVISLSSIASSSFGYGRSSSGGLRGKAMSTLLKGSSPSKCRLPQPKRRSFSPTDFAHEDFVPWFDHVDTNFFTREDDHYTEDILERRPEAEKWETPPLHMESLIGSPLNRAELETKQQMLPTEPGWRKSKEASTVGPTRHPLRQEVVSGEGRSRGSRISPTVHTLMLGGHRYRRPHLVRQLNNRGQSHCGCNRGPVCCLVEETEEFRPFFTYFITTLHILITVLSVAVHGISPIGFREAKSNTTVLMSTGGYEEVTHIEHWNIFIGPNSHSPILKAKIPLSDEGLMAKPSFPNQDTLVRLGATFAPCMRPESGYLKMFQSVRAVEQASGCCLRRNGLTCLQTTQEACGEDLNTWITWSQNKPHLTTEKTQRTSGPVCGQDPRMCEEPASSQGQEWPNDITYWPVCKRVGQNNETALPHMDCNITGRPCCFSRAGRCEITSQQYCDFKKGHFHPEATLCSQIKCMGDACGLLPFWNPDVPDQLYRPLISLFLHAGVMHCLISVTVNVILVRGLEKLIGWLRISLLYISCGITGNLLSAILLPHSINVGPWSAHVGIFVCVLLQLLQSWHAFEKPWQALARFSAFGIILILISLLPSIDLVAEVGGIVAGFLLAFALLPYIGLGHQNGQAARHCFPLIISFLTFAITITGFLAIFYLFPFYCGWCHYLNCIPFTEGFCEKHNLW